VKSEESGVKGKRYIQVIMLFIAVLAAPAHAHAFAATIIGAVMMVGSAVLGGGLAGLTAVGVASVLTSAALYGAAMGTLAWGVNRLTSKDPQGQDSANLDGATPQITVSANTPISKAYGLNQIAGNIVRQNDFKQEDYIKLVVDYGQGEWDAFLGHLINNDLDWDHLVDTHTKYEHLGALDQTGINNLFTQDACNFRGDAVVEYSIETSTSTDYGHLSDLSNLISAARTSLCLEIGEDLGGTESYSSNNAQGLWDFYLKVKKIPVAELDENAWLSLEAYCSTSLCYSDKNNYLVNVPLATDSMALSTTHYQNQTASCAVNVNNPTLGKFAKTDMTTWASANGSVSDQCLVFDFGRQVVITKIRICNYHKGGSDTNRGMKNFTLQGSNTAADFSSGATYAYTGDWTEIGSAMQADQHVASDVEDWQDINISNAVGYRYHRFKIADNWGDDEFLGVRHILFYTGNASGECTGDEVNLRRSFNYIFDTKIEVNDMEKLMWQGFNGQVIRSNGKHKPVWEGAKEADGAGALQNKAVKHAFVVSGASGNVVQDSFSWEKSARYNVFIVNYRNAAKNFTKDTIILKDDADIAIRGEITFEETCLYIIDEALAFRRCRLNYNKFTYPDYECKLTGFPDSQAVELYDRVTVTDSSAWWTAKDFIVTGKGEDQYGRSIFAMRSYLSGIYEDGGWEDQTGYATVFPVPDPTEVTVTASTNLSYNSWQQVCYGHGLFVAVGYSGSAGRCATSPDGITWTDRTMPAGVWRAVCYSPELDRFVASGPRFIYSDNGIDWSECVNTYSGNVIWSPGLNLFVAVYGTYPTIRTAYSSDGTNWSNTLVTGYLYPISPIVWNSDDSVFLAGCAAGRYNSDSPDGIAWTQRFLNSKGFDNLSYGSGLGYGASGFPADSTTLRKLVNSPDGIDWTWSDAPQCPAAMPSCYAEYYGGLIALADSNGAAGPIHEAWYYRGGAWHKMADLPHNSNSGGWSSICYSDERLRAVAVSPYGDAGWRALVLYK
jgi:hypothetical protein